MPRSDNLKNKTPITLRIQSRYDGLKETEQRIAQKVLEAPEEVIHLSISQLAEKCGVSKATIVRFCNRMGFKGYHDFKIKLAQELTTPIDNTYAPKTVADISGDFINHIFWGMAQTINSTKEVIDPIELAKAVKAILQARKVIIFGLGNSAGVAVDAQYKLLRIGIDCVVYCDNHFQVFAASRLSPEDVLIAISKSGFSRDIVEGLQLAKERGATTICITDYSRSPVQRFSDIKLFMASYELYEPQWDFFITLGQVAVVDTLVISIALKKQAEAKLEIDQMDKALQIKKY